MGLFIGGAAQSGYVTVGGVRQGGGSETYSLSFGGYLDSPGKLQRVNGVSNDTCYTLYSESSEMGAPADATVTRVRFARSNTTGDVVIRVQVDGSDAGDALTIEDGVASKWWDTSIAVSAESDLAIKYVSTTSANPELTHGFLLLVAS